MKKCENIWKLLRRLARLLSKRNDTPSEFQANFLCVGGELTNDSSD